MSVVKKISRKDLSRLLDEWSRDFSVLAPSRESGTVRMAEWGGGDASFMDWYRNSVIPPKNIMLPLVEKMFSYNKNAGGYNLETPPPDEKSSLFSAYAPAMPGR